MDFKSEYYIKTYRSYLKNLRKSEPKLGQEVNFTFMIEGQLYVHLNISGKVCIKITAYLLIKLFKIATKSI